MTCRPLNQLVRKLLGANFSAVSALWLWLLVFVCWHVLFYFVFHTDDYCVNGPQGDGQVAFGHPQCHYLESPWLSCCQCFASFSDTLETQVAVCVCTSRTLWFVQSPGELGCGLGPCKPSKKEGVWGSQSLGEMTLLPFSPPVWAGNKCYLFSVDSGMTVNIFKGVSGVQGLSWPFCCL